MVVMMVVVVILSKLNARARRTRGIVRLQRRHGIRNRCKQIDIRLRGRYCCGSWHCGSGLPRSIEGKHCSGAAQQQRRPLSHCAVLRI
jgi:hypothetical protein